MMRFRPILLLVAAALFGGSAFAADPPKWRVPPNELVPKITFAAAQKATLDWGTTFIKSPEAWQTNPLSKGKGVKIAVLDTGCDIKHPAVQSRVKGTYNAITKAADVTDAQGHGTHVADTTGHIAPESDLYIVKVLGDDGSGSVVDIAHGIDYAVTTFKVDIISMSLGGPAPDQWSKDAIKKATDAGVIVVAAAGNDGPSANTEGYPGRYPEVISVAAHDCNSMVANFSSRGPNVFSCLPGVDITAAWPHNRQSTISGTSMATPHQAGACAAWIATHPEIPKSARIAAFRKELQNALSHPASKTAASGYGSLDLTKLVPVSNPPKPPEPPTPVGAVQITLADLTPGAVLRLNAAGIGSLSLSITPLTKPADVVPPTVPAPTLTPVSLPTWSVIPYAELRGRVSRGERVQVAHGVVGPVGMLAVDTIPGFPPGVYDCYPSESGPMLVRVAGSAPAAVQQSAPVFSTPIRSGIYNLTGIPLGGSCANGQCTTQPASQQFRQYLSQPLQRCTGPNCPK